MCISIFPAFPLTSQILPALPPVLTVVSIFLPLAYPPCLSFGSRAWAREPAAFSFLRAARRALSSARSQWSAMASILAGWLVRFNS